MERINIEYLYDNGQSDYTFYNWIFGGENVLGMHLGFWEKETRTMFQAQQNENEYVVRTLNLKKSDKILDAGCGVGGTMTFLATKHGLSSTGITISGEQVKRGEYYANKNSISHLLNFDKQDYHDTDFPDNTFDKIYAIESSDAANTVQRFIGEMFRILKPGGSLLILDAFMKGHELAPKHQKQLAHVCNGWSISDPNTISYWCSHLETKGFSNVRTEDLTDKVYKSSKTSYALAMVATPIWLSLSYFKIFNKAHFANLNACKGLFRLFRADKIMYASIIATKPNA